MNPRRAAEVWNVAGIKPYLTVGLVALGVIAAVLLQSTSGIVAFIPVVAGIAGGLSGLGPTLVVVSVAVCLNAPAFVEPATSRRMIMDGVLCAAVLAYVIAHARAQAILAYIYPADHGPRAVSAGQTGLRGLFRRSRPARQRRSAELVSEPEVSAMIWSLPVWAVLAHYVLLAAPEDVVVAGLPPPFGQVVILVWSIGLIWYVVFGFLAYLRYRQMRADEATVCLQDMLWAETRREQRRVNRWLAWHRGRQRRKEK
jgi:hypothetical protein